MNLKQALQAISKSSPTTVTTTGEIEDPHLRAIKEYLYAKTPIENVLIEKLQSANSDTIIFLRSSRGDRKSEILSVAKKNTATNLYSILMRLISFTPTKRLSKP